MENTGKTMNKDIKKKKIHKLSYKNLQSRKEILV